MARPTSSQRQYAIDRVRDILTKRERVAYEELNKKYKAQIDALKVDSTILYNKFYKTYKKQVDALIKKANLPTGVKCTANHGLLYVDFECPGYFNIQKEAHIKLFQDAEMEIMLGDTDELAKIIKRIEKTK